MANASFDELVVSGSIGIGVDQPNLNNKLQVEGNIHLDGNAIFLREDAGDQNDFIKWNPATDQIDMGGWNGVSFGPTQGNANQVVTPGLTVDMIGRVGVGTTTPDDQLTVDPKGIGGLSGISIGTPPTITAGGTTGGFTNLWMRINSATNGHAVVQSVKSTGSEDSRGIQSVATVYGELGLNPFGGNVGVGTTTPSAKLNVDPQGAGGIVIGNPSTGTGGFTSLLMGISAESGGHASLQGIKASGSAWGDIIVNSSGGNVGIGTTAPAAKLEVDGTAQVNGDMAIYGNLKVSYDIVLTGADCAEDFDVSCTEMVEAGTVMVLDETGGLRPSFRANDKRVAGVISGAGGLRPGIIMDKQQEGCNRLPVALNGKVYCKVDAQYGAVEVGDLLTTSETPGHAMKAGDAFKAFGAVIGKALRGLDEGKGLIPILVALQ